MIGHPNPVGLGFDASLELSGNINLFDSSILYKITRMPYSSMKDFFLYML